MGQKVHPLGFRVGITKKHQSQWFARFNKHKYAQSVLEDLMLRKTLTNLFPNLLNPIFKKVQKRDDESGLTPRITQIKIERGLIPYEIGIQIHAENCELIKSSIENLKPGHDLVCKLQKTRHYLQYLRSNLENYQTISESLNLTADNKKAGSREAKLPLEASGSVVNQSTTQLKKTKEADRKWKKGIHVENLFKKGAFYTKKKRFDNKSKSAFSKSQLRRQRLILKRLKKRQFIKLRYKLLINKGLLLTKKGNKVIQKINSAYLSREREAKSLSSRAQEGVLRERTPRDAASLSRDESFLSTKQANFDQKKGISRSRAVLAQKDLLFTKKKGGLNKTKSPLLSKQTGSIMMSKNTRGEIRSKNYVSFNVFKSRIKKKFVSIFLNRMNKKFLQVLKISLIEASKRSTAMYTPLGWSKKWDFNLVKKSLGLKSLKMLTKLISVLEQKLLNKMESLRNEFLTFGSITKASSLRYYQMLTFLKQLKEYVSQLKRKQKFQKHFNKLSSEGTSSFNEGLSFASLREGDAEFAAELRRAPSLSSPKATQGAEFAERLGAEFAERLGAEMRRGPLAPRDSVHESLIKKSNLQNLNNKVDTHTVMFYVLSKKLNNIENECRKMKFIEYLKQLIKKHRSENIYYYLTTIAEARQDLRKLKKFIQNHASFLFGLNLTNSNVQDTNNAVASLHEGNRVIVKERLHNVLAKNAVKLELEKTLQDIFLEQIDKQRNMYIENAQLIPKIALKFYSVNTKSLKAKASIVANSVVDALEKRKAFRKVIKDAKEELMRTQGVKGVKIQVSGRLNGAEIARSEWVRAGRVPLQTLRANLDYSYKTANTIYGIIGVKVWIFKGYIKLI